MKLTITVGKDTIRTDTYWDPEEQMSQFEEVSVLAEALAVGIREVAKMYIPDKDKQCSFVAAVCKVADMIV